MDNKPAGNYGEDLACEYLKQQGYKILDRNYRIRGGEIDIVAKDGDYLVFVEVKSRWSHEYGPPSESMTPWKIKHLLKTAQFYVQKINWGEKPYRLDFVSIDFAEDKNNPKIELIKNITS
ncbi:MAG: YraN family protein [Candidatus Daviesbacteria bacterium]|nr:YraN family protein [Candidatus Daviesbacteria bacterium]